MLKCMRPLKVSAEIYNLGAISQKKKYSPHSMFWNCKDVILFMEVVEHDCFLMSKLYS